MNYDVLSKHVGALGRVPWAGLVFDEAHYLKNHTSARSKLARQLAEQAATNAAREPAVYLLTGTPLTNRPRDLFVLLQLVGHSLGRSFLSFAKRYCAAEKTEYGWKTDGASNLEELTVQLHGVMLRRSKEEVLTLPPKLRTWLPVDVPAGTGASEIHDVVDLLLGRSGPRAGGASVDDDGRARTHLLALLTKARQKIAAAKVGATSDFVSGAVDQGEKVIVFSCFDEPLQKLAKDFGDAAVLLTGRTPTSKRQALVDRFQEDESVRVFLANIIAGGIGLNLTAASQVVFNELGLGARQSLAGGGPRVPDRSNADRQRHLSDRHRHDRRFRPGRARSEGCAGQCGCGRQGAGRGSVRQRARRTGAGLARDFARACRHARFYRGRGRDRAAAPRSVRRVAGARIALGKGRPSRRPEDIDALRRALEALARVLSGPSVNRYRIESTSQSGDD